MLRLREDPGIIKSAVEELLRFDGPLATATERYAREDVPIAGTTIPRGALVYAVLGSANRDERQFPDPDKLDLTREPTDIWHSGWESFTTASARHSRDSKARSRSARSCVGCRISGSRSRGLRGGVGLVAVWLRSRRI